LSISSPQTLRPFGDFAIEEGKSVSETITKDWHEPWRLDDIQSKPLASKKVVTDHAD
jgi:hypothetical protein